MNFFHLRDEYQKIIDFFSRDYCNLKGGPELVNGLVSCCPHCLNCRSATFTSGSPVVLPVSNGEYSGIPAIKFQDIDEGDPGSPLFVMFFSPDSRWLVWPQNILEDFNLNL